MIDPETQAWLALANAYLTGEQAHALLERFGTMADAVDKSATRLRAAGISDAAIARLGKLDDTGLQLADDWLQGPDNHLIIYSSADYPSLLRQIQDAPALLFVKGNIDALHLPALAIVGSRNPTRGGSQTAHDFAADLGKAGFCIMSGLAQGIDSAAHDGALSCQGRTVAFLGHGIDRVYPASNRDLAHAIVADGALVSEYPLGTPPRKENFPQRNRLISGCSMGTLVVEAARRSGSLITARLASEQGRDVFAIPGSIHNALSRGCHQLIRSGAKLVECTADIVSELDALATLMLSAANETGNAANVDAQLMQNDSADDHPQDVSNDRDDDYKLLIKTLGHDPISADEIVAKSGLTIDQVSSMLLILELEGEIETLNSGQFTLIRSCSWHERKCTRRTDVSV